MDKMRITEGFHFHLPISNKYVFSQQWYMLKQLMLHRTSILFMWSVPTTLRSSWSVRVYAELNQELHAKFDLILIWDNICVLPVLPNKHSFKLLSCQFIKYFLSVAQTASVKPEICHLSNLGKPCHSFYCFVRGYTSEWYKGVLLESYARFLTLEVVFSSGNVISSLLSKIYLVDLDCALV